MRFTDADVVLVGLLLAVTLALAGYALGGADAAGGAAPGRVQWADLDPRAWLSFSGMVATPAPEPVG